MEKNIYVILVNYNGYKDTIECIESLRVSYQCCLSIVVVDNASTDESVRLLTEYNKEYFVLICAKENNGFSSGNNIGIKYALGCGADYVLLLNNDTIVESNFINTLMNDTPEAIGISTCKIIYYSNHNRIWYAGGSFNRRTLKPRHFRYNETMTTLSSSESREVTFISGCCMYISKDTIEKIGLLDESFFLYAEDLEYCIRASKHGVHMYYIDKPLVYHKVSASANKLSGMAQYYIIRNQVFILKKYGSIFCGCLSLGIQCIIRILKGEYSINMVCKAIKDGIQNVHGKVCY